MIKYLLDTNICIYIIKKKPQSVIARLQTYQLEEIGISTISLSELEYGVQKSAYPEKNKLALIEFLIPFNIIEYNQAASEVYGSIRSQLERSGEIIGPKDMLLASQAVSMNIVLITNNEKEFKRVTKLKIENWINK